MTFHIITLFPESLNSYVESSIVGRAIREKKIKLRFYNPRDFISAKNKSGYKQVDNKAYGGGPGMVMEALPILKAVEAALKKIEKTKPASRFKPRLVDVTRHDSRRIRLRDMISAKSKTKVILFAAGGKQFTNQLARQWENKFDHLIMICGRYEGIDARVKKILKTCLPAGRAEEISIGPFVLTGGELPAMVVIDAVARQTEGVLGKFESLEEERVASGEVYTRPEVLNYPFDKAQGRQKKYRVPKILLSGNHAKIEEWRQSRQPKRK